MIDENKLIEDIIWKVKEQVFKSEEVGYNRPFCDKANVIECINNQPKVGEWILCSERMPEENQNVIACFAHGTVTELSFYDERFHGISSYDKKVIIAWQPLPEAHHDERGGLF